MGNFLSPNRRPAVDEDRDTHLNTVPLSLSNAVTQPVTSTTTTSAPGSSQDPVAHLETQQSSNALASVSSKPPATAVTQNLAATNDTQYTVFISHAGEDKATIAIPLRKQLADHGISAFVDEPDLQPGTEAEKAMISAMETANVAVIVLSPEFVARKWPMKEAMCFLGRRNRTVDDTECCPVIIPFFYRLSIAELCDEPRLDRVGKDGNLLYLQSRFYERMENGEPEASIAGIKVALQKLRRITGVRNDVDATNDSAYVMSYRREILVQTLCEKVIQAVPKGSVQRNTNMAEARGEVDRFRSYFYEWLDSSKLVFQFCTANESTSRRTQDSELLEIVIDSSPSGNRAIAVHGMGGVGKTSILRGMSQIETVQQRFENGVHFVALGVDATEHNVIGALSSAVENSGGRNIASEMRKEKEWQTVVDCFRSWFAKKQCLFMVDDVWENQKLSPGVIQELMRLHASGRDSKVLLTTRSMEIAGEADKCFRLEPREPLGAEARAILVRYSLLKPNMEDENERKVLEEILERCSGLPLFLAVAGKAVRTLSLRSGSSGLRAYHVYNRRLDVDLKNLVNKDVGMYQRLQLTLSCSIKLLEDKIRALRFNVPLAVAEMHRRLSVTERQEKVPMSMLRHLWELQSEAEAAIVAQEFEQMALADIEVNGSESGYKEMLRLHDSLHLFSSTEAKRQGEEKIGHEAVLNGYGEGLRRVDGCRTWWSREVEADGYVHGSACRHLFRAGLVMELVSLLMTPRWTARQLEINGILVLDGDFSLGIKAAQEGRIDEDADRRYEIERTLELISEAVRLSWTFVAYNDRELWFQLHGRLIRVANEVGGVQEYVTRIETEAERPQVRMESCLLAEPGSVNTKIISIGSQVACMAIMEDGERVACGCVDGRVVVNLRRGEIEKSWKAHDILAFGIAMGRQDLRLVSVSTDTSFTVWDVENDRGLATFKGHTDFVTCVTTMRDGKRVVTGSDDGTAQVWDMDTGQAVSEPFRGHNGPVRCVAVLSDGEHVVTGGGDKMLRIWSATSGAQAGQPLVGHEKFVTCVAVTPDGGRIVSGSQDMTVRIWDMEHQEQVGKPLIGHKNSVTSVAVSKDGTRIVSGSYDSTIRVWDAESGEEVCDPLEGHTRFVTGVSFLAGRDSVVSCSWDGSVRLWNVRRKNAGRAAGRHEECVNIVVFTPDGKRVVSGSDDLTLRIWDVKCGQQVGDPLRGHSNLVHGVSVMPDGHRAVSVSRDKTIRVWDLQSRELLHILTGHSDEIKCVAVTPNGQRVVTGSADKTVRIWNMRAMDGRHLVFVGHRAGVRRVFVSDDGNRIISVDYEDNIFVWELEKRQQVKRVSKENAQWLSRKQILDHVEETTIHGHGGLSILLWEREIKYWDGENTEVLGTLEADVSSWALSPDGKTICLGLRDGKVGFMKLER